jgi:hypothetical protein
MTKLIPTAEVLSGCYGRYLCCYDTNVRVRVVSDEDTASDVFGECRPAGREWLLTAALVVLAWEAAVDVVYAIQDVERDVAWRVAKTTTGYTGMAHDFYEDGEGWMVVVMKPLASC